MRRRMEDRERRERRNNLVIRGLKGKGRKELTQTAERFLEEEFGVKEGVKEVRTVGREGREIVVIQMESWEKKERIMREKKKLGNRKVYIDNDLTQEERETQRKLRIIAGGQRAKG